MHSTIPVSARGVDAFLRQQRAQGTLYREQRPAPDLTPFVACGWVRVEGMAADAPPMPVVPDGCADLITCDDGPPLLVGPDTGARWPSLADGTVITGLRLRPGALRAVIACPAARLLDSSVPLCDLVAGTQHLHAALRAAGTLHARLAELERWVRDRLRATARDRAVMHACHTLVSQPGADIADVATALGWNVPALGRWLDADWLDAPR